jgi:hypothetical protein
MGATWWNQVLDGKLRHIDPRTTQFGSLASLRAAIYREAKNRGITVQTHVPKEELRLYIQAGSDYPITQDRLSTSLKVWVPAPGSSISPRRDVMEQALRLPLGEIRVLAEHLRQYVESVDFEGARADELCTCGAKGSNQSHPPSCRVWGLPAQTQPAGTTGMTGTT